MLPLQLTGSLTVKQIERFTRFREQKIILFLACREYYLKIILDDYSLL